MKTMKPLLTLICLVLIWAGCHGKATGPTAPPPSDHVAQVSGDKKGGGGGSSPVYTYVQSGDLGETPSPADAIGLRNGDVEMGLCCGANQSIEQLVVSGAFLQANFGGDAAACFGAGDLVVDFAGWIRDGQRGISGEYYFDAYGTDGTSVFSYALNLTAASVAGEFPPTQGGSATIVWDSVGELNTEGSGKGKKGGNAGSACVGEVTIGASITVTEAG